MRPQPPGQAEHCAYLLPYVHVPGVSVGKGTKARIGLQIRAWACNLGVLVGHSPYPAHLARARAGRPSTCETHGRAEFATRVKRCAITARAHRAAGAPACTSRLLLAALSACVWQASGAGHQGTRRSVHAPRDIRHDGRFRLILRGVAFFSASAVPPRGSVRRLSPRSGERALRPRPPAAAIHARRAGAASARCCRRSEAEREHQERRRRRRPGREPAAGALPSRRCCCAAALLQRRAAAPRAPALVCRCAVLVRHGSDSPRVPSAVRRGALGVR